MALIALAQILTNKTINADNNTITNIGDDELTSGIDMNKIDYLYGDAGLNYGLGDGAAPLSGSGNARCVASGYHCMRSAVNCTWTVGSGYGTLESANNADYCVCIGYNSAITLASASNVTIGYTAGSALTTNSPDNILIGTSCGRYATVNFYGNIAIGRSALVSAANISTYYNVCIGYTSGSLLAASITSYDNVLLGRGTNGSDGLINCICIGAANTYNINNGISIGNASSTTLELPGTNFGTDGLVVAASNLISSTTTVTPEMRFDGGITLATSGGTAAVLDFYEEDYTHTTNWTGAKVTGNIAGNLLCSRIGNKVTINFPEIQGVGTTGEAAAVLNMATVIAVRYRPLTSMFFIIRGLDVGTDTFVTLHIETDGNRSIGVGAAMAVFGGDDVNINGSYNSSVSYLV